MVHAFKKEQLSESWNLEFHAVNDLEIVFLVLVLRDELLLDRYHLLLLILAQETDIVALF